MVHIRSECHVYMIWYMIWYCMLNVSHFRFTSGSETGSFTRLVSVIFKRKKKSWTTVMRQWTMRSWQFIFSNKWHFSSDAIATQSLNMEQPEGWRLCLTYGCIISHAVWIILKGHAWKGRKYGSGLFALEFLA